MANYFCQFSEVITRLTDDEEKWMSEELLVNFDHMTTEEEKEWKETRNTPACGIDEGSNWPEFEWEIETNREWGKHLWVSYLEGSNMDNVLNLFQRFLKKFRPEELLVLRWAETCDRPRVGAFGGGVYIIGATEDVYLNTTEWMQNRLYNWPEKKWSGPEQ